MRKSISRGAGSVSGLPQLGERWEIRLLYNERYDMRSRGGAEVENTAIHRCGHPFSAVGGLRKPAHPTQPGKRLG